MKVEVPAALKVDLLEHCCVTITSVVPEMSPLAVQADGQFHYYSERMQSLWLTGSVVSNIAVI